MEMCGMTGAAPLQSVCIRGNEVGLVLGERDCLAGSSRACGRRRCSQTIPRE